jgi:glyoxylase-like metal-dependent hydrolase (beta-lactamase superfamily II)
MKRLILLLALLTPLVRYPGMADGKDAPIRTGPSFPFAPELRHERDFVRSGSLEKLSAHLYRLDDTCNVYIVRDGQTALLIGFGSGEVLKRLAEIGITRVERVLATHHHRNLVQGLCDLAEIPFRVTVPAAEADQFEKVETFWGQRELSLNLDCRSSWNTVRRSIRVDERVGEGDEVSWRGYRFRVLETPGATDHSISYSTMIDGRRTVFCGDLIAGEGKVQNWYDLHWDYYGFTQGINASDKSFARIRAEKPALLLPAHGRPISRPERAMTANARIHETLRELLIPNELRRVHQEVRGILPHLVFVGANGYAILSKSGKAFFWDYGFIDQERIAELKKRFGVKTIDAVSFSHYHDDHIMRTWELLREKTSVWVFENLADIFAHPQNYRLPDLVPFPIRFNRVLKDGETVKWEEYELRFFHLPGQTEFHMGMSTEIDGRKVMFTGDDTWNKLHPEKPLNGPLVPQNEYFLDGGFIACARRMRADPPDLVCPAHTEEYAPSREDLKEFENWALRLRQVMTGFIDQPDPNFGMDVGWCRFYPYLSTAGCGGDFSVDLLVRNHLFRPAALAVTIRTSDGLECRDPSRSFTIPEKTQAVVTFALHRTAAGTACRGVITADITINGRRIGEYAEALVD